MLKIFKPILKIICFAAAFVLAVLLVVNVGQKLAYSEFYKNSEREFKIPGLSDGFVPQGLDYDETEDRYLTCGYSTKGASRVYTFNSDGNNAVKCELKNADGGDYAGHTGGICRNGDYVYITSDDGLDVFRYNEIASGGDAVVIGAFKTGNNPAYCHIENGKIYVGSFYREGNYETLERERIITPAGDKNSSTIEVYRLDEDAEFGVNPAVERIYSAPGLVQGMCFDDRGRIILSTSYGLASSHLYVYDSSESVSGETEFNGTAADLFYLDGASLVQTVKAPPMSEEIIFRDGRIIIMTESASNKYIFGKFTGGKYAYGVKL